MADEGSRSIDRQAWGDRADEPSMAGEGSRLMAAEIASKLRAAGLGCEIVNLVPTPTAVLRRDRIIIVLRHGHDWVADDSVRHGVDDTGRLAVAGDGVRVRICHVGRDDGRHDDALGSANVSHVRPYGPTNCGERHAIRCNCLVRCRLFPCLGQLRAARHTRAMGV